MVVQTSLEMWLDCCKNGSSDTADEEVVDVEVLKVVATHSTAHSPNVV